MRRLLLWLAAFAGIAALVALTFDPNWLKGPVERAVSARVGRTFEIQGDFDIALRWHPRLTMERVRLANPPWAQEAETLRLERAQVSLALLPLLRGEVVLPEVTLTHPVIALERSAGGADNWTLPRGGTTEPGKPGQPPVIGLLAIDRGVVRFRDPAQKTAVDLQVETTQGRHGTGVRIRATGQARGTSLEASGTGGAVLSLADTTLPYPFDVRLRVGATAVSATGSITGLAALAAADLRLDVRGESASHLYDMIGLAIPPTPPYRVSGRVIRDKQWWRFHGFEGHVGDSDLSGDIDLAYLDGRAQLLARLESKVLDIDDLGGFIGAGPETGAGETASPGQERRADAKAARPRVLPDLPIKLDRLRAMDADVRFTGKSIRGRTPVDDLTAHIMLRDGVLRFEPLDFGVAGGNVVSKLTLDGREPRAGVDGAFEFRRLNLRELFPGNQVVAKSTGLVGGRAALSGSGNTLAEVLADADGRLGLASSGGRISNLAVELAGLDVAEALRLLFAGDESVRVRCAVADVAIRNGVIRTRQVLVDTTDTNLKIEGEVNLAREELDLTLHPLPKDYSLLSLRSPIHLRGTFKDPAIRPDKALALRGGLAAILGAAVTPLAALVPLIESGPGDDADCERLVAAVQRHAAAPVRKGAAAARAGARKFRRHDGPEARRRR